MNEWMNELINESEIFTKNDRDTEYLTKGKVINF